jgi:hypothetical protein
MEGQLRQWLTLRPDLLELAADVARVERPAVVHREDVTVTHPSLSRGLSASRLWCVGELLLFELRLTGREGKKRN